MNPTMSRWLKILALPLAAALIMGACSSDDERTPTADRRRLRQPDRRRWSSPAPRRSSPSRSPGRRSSTRTNPEVDITVDGPGTGDGFELFCDGETDISDASVRSRTRRSQTARTNGIEFIELQVGIRRHRRDDQPGQRRLECLTSPTSTPWSARSPRASSNWSDGQELADELGSTTDLPDAPLDITGPGEESGTYDSFVELVDRGHAEEQRRHRGRAQPPVPTTRPPPTTTSSSRASQGSDTSFGWVGFAFAEEAGTASRSSRSPRARRRLHRADRPRPSPTAATRSRRPLFIYVNAGKAEENAAAVGVRRLLPLRRRHRRGDRGRLRRPPAPTSSRRPARPGTIGPPVPRRPDRPAWRTGVRAGGRHPRSGPVPVCRSALDPAPSHRSGRNRCRQLTVDDLQGNPGGSAPSGSCMSLLWRAAFLS